MVCFDVCGHVLVVADAGSLRGSTLLIHISNSLGNKTHPSDKSRESLNGLLTYRDKGGANGCASSQNLPSWNQHVQLRLTEKHRDRRQFALNIHI